MFFHVPYQCTYVSFFQKFFRGDAFLESYIDGLARTQEPVVTGPEDDEHDGNSIRTGDKRFRDGDDFADGQDFCKFNSLSQVSVIRPARVDGFIYLSLFQ